MPRRLLALLAVAVFAAACGDSSDSEGAQDPPADAGQRVALKALDFSFTPTEIQADPGSSLTVEITNGGGVPHSFTVDDADVDVTVEAGASGVAAFDVPDEDATLEFHCRFHPDEMNGTIVVGSGGAGGSSEKDSKDSKDSEDSGGYDY